MNTQLLCTFVADENLDETLSMIVGNYDIAFDTIYILKNTDTPCALCCTYNIFIESQIGDQIPQNTISLHRKKTSNTLYTINALNLLVKSLNNGVLNNRFEVPWAEYKNTILVTAYGKLKVINTKLDRIVKVSEI